MIPADELRLAARLRTRADRLLEKFQRQGGRGIALAERINRLNIAAAALDGTLFCPYCQAQLAGDAD